MKELDDWVLEKLVECKEYWENPYAGPAFMGGMWVVFVALAMIASSIMAWHSGYSSVPSNLGMLMIGLIFLPYVVFSAYKATEEYEETKGQSKAGSSYRDDKIF